MTVTDEMVKAAEKAAKNEFVYWSGAARSEEFSKAIRAALEAALSVAPPSDDYRRGLEDAARVVEQWTIPTIQSPSMWLIDKPGIAAAIRAAAKGE